MPDDFASPARAAFGGEATTRAAMRNGNGANGRVEGETSNVAAPKRDAFSPPISVAVFASAYHPSVGGVEEVVRQLARVLNERGARTVVVSDRWPRDLPLRYEHDGVPVYRPLMRFPAAPARSRVTYALGKNCSLRQTRDIVQGENASLVHVHCFAQNGFYALQTARALKLPLILSLHGELTMDASGFYDLAWGRDALREALGEARLITACSQQTLSEAEAFYGRSFGARGRVIYNGIDTREFENVAPLQRARPYVFAIGRHVKPKGFDVLLRAYAKWHEQDDDAPDLIIGGDGEERQALQSLARELKVSEHVTFPGRMARREVAQAFAGAALFALPSRHEPFGIVNLEAMASGKAVVATRVGGVPEIVRDGETGLLVSPDDPNALCEAMCRVWNDAALRDRLERAGRTFALSCDWERVCDAWMEVYREALKTE